jgi:hypothetical protein
VQVFLLNLALKPDSPCAALCCLQALQAAQYLVIDDCGSKVRHTRCPPLIMIVLSVAATHCGSEHITAAAFFLPHIADVVELLSMPECVAVRCELCAEAQQVLLVWAVKWIAGNAVYYSL